MNIAILGGSFDPPHIWHFWTGQQVLEYVRGIDQVWFLPDYIHAFKPAIAPVHDRVAMLHYLETGRMKVSTIAAAKSTTTYTVEIVSELMKDQQNKYYWIVGSDVVMDFSKWRDYQKLSRMIQFLVFPRKDYPIQNLPSGFYRIEGNLMVSNLSSTLIRSRVKQQRSISGLVFPEVEEYIQSRKLYL